MLTMHLYGGGGGGEGYNLKFLKKKLKIYILKKHDAKFIILKNSR